jgi:iron complex outermembrane receptor protein
MPTIKRSPLALAIAAACVLAPLAVNAAPAPAPEPAPQPEAEASPDPAADPEAAAQEADKSEAAQLGSITVTARRREENLNEIPVAVTALGEGKIETLNIEDLGDLQGQVPNLTIYAARGSSSTVTAYIRGIGQSDPLWGVEPGVGVYIDDVYVARPQGALLDVLDVDRIEILRGPQGTLYGKNTIGGAIKYVTKPLLPDFSAKVSLTAGEYEQLDAKASVNFPLGSDALVGRFSAASLSRDGFGENQVTGAPISDKEILVARGTLGFYPSDTLNVIVSADWMDDQSGVRGAQMLATNRFAPTLPPLRSRYDVRNGMPNVNDTSMQGASATVNWQVNEAWSFKSVTAYRESDTVTNIDFDTLPNVIADVRAEYEDDQFTQEFQGTYLGETISGVVGLYYFDGTAGGTVRNNFFNLQFGTTNGFVDTTQTALYGEGTWQASERLKVTAGARWTREEKDADVLNQGFANAQFVTPIATLADFTDSLSTTNISPKLSLDYQATDNTMVYGLVSRGFKSGGYNIRANTVSFPLSARPFKDESVTSFEIGSKSALYDETFFFNVAYFWNKYKDVQLSVFTSFTLPNGQSSFFGDFTNAGEADVKGVEVEFVANPTERLTLSGNIAYLDAQYNEFIDRGVNVARLQEFTNAPPYQAGLTAQYRWDVFGGELSGRVTGTYQGRVVPTTDLSPAIQQAPYALIGAGLLWRSEDSPWTFALQGSNLTDREYRTTGYNIAGLGVLTGFYGPPRQISLTAAYTFD